MYRANRIVPLILILAAIGCTQPETQQSDVPKADEPTPATAQAGPTRVTKVVFIGQKDSCKCTRERIDKTWPVVDSVLKGYKDITVRKIQIDVEAEEADRYDEMKSIMIAPGIFFMDKDDKLVEMIQGEVSADQVLAALKK